MISGIKQAGRFVFVLVTIVAWFAITNHCALGAVTALQSKTVSMHCHGSGPVPAKDGKEQAPCCKVLKAVVLAKVAAAGNALDFIHKDYPAPQSFTGILHAEMHTLGLDTGPPEALSFSESVLQRSILAHAPPSLLS